MEYLNKDKEGKFVALVIFGVRTVHFAKKKMQCTPYLDIFTLCGVDIMYYMHDNSDIFTIYNPILPYIIHSTYPLVSVPKHTCTI